MSSTSGIFSSEAEWALMGAAEDYQRLFLSEGAGAEGPLPGVPGHYVHQPRQYPQNSLQNPHLHHQHLQQHHSHPQSQASWTPIQYSDSHGGAGANAYARPPHQPLSRSYSTTTASGVQPVQGHLSTATPIPEHSIPSLPPSTSSLSDGNPHRARATSTSGLSYTSSLTSRSNSPLVNVSTMPTTQASGLGISATVGDATNSQHYPTSMPAQGVGSDMSRSTHSPRVGDSLTAYGHWNPASSVWTCAYPGCTSRVTFTRGCDLRKHYKRHTKWLFCRWEGCPSATEGGFSSKKDRARHEAKHNPGIRCTEPGCGRVFSRVDNMKDHVKRIHRRANTTGSSSSQSQALAQGAGAATIPGQGLQGQTQQNGDGSTR